MIPKRIFFKIVLILTGVVLLILLVINPILKHSMISLVKNKLTGNFYYQFENLSVDLLSRSVTLENINWKFPKDTTVFNQGGYLRQFKISGISLISLMGKDVNINKIEFDSLTLLTRIEGPVNKNDSSDIKADLTSFNFFSLIKGQINSLKVKSITINEGNAIWLNPENNKIWRKIHGVEFEINSIKLDSATSANNNGWFTLEDLQLNANSSEIFLPDSLHKIATGPLMLDYKNHKITIDSLQLIPLFSRSQMSRIVRYQTDRLKMVIPNITITGFDISNWMLRNTLSIEALKINNLSLLAFRDKNLLFPPHHFPALPHLALKHAKINMKIDSVTLANALITYEQLSNETQKIGTVFFNHLDANILNITNNTSSIKQNDKATMKVITQLMGKGKLVADFTFNLNDKNGDHWVNGTLSKFDLSNLNTAFVPLTAISIRSGMVNEMQFSFRLNNDVSDGQLKFLYSNLKIDKLSKTNLSSSGLDNSFQSLLANTFLIKADNPSGNKEPRIGIIHFERIKEKSIFNFWLKSVLEGMKSTVLTTEDSKSNK